MNKDKSNQLIIILLLVIIIIFLVTIILLLKPNNINNNNSQEKALQEEQKANNFKIKYTTEEYTTKRSDGTEVSRSIRNLPIITNEYNQEIADKIANQLNAISNKEWIIIKEMADSVAENNIPYTGLGVTYLFSKYDVVKDRLTINADLIGAFGGVPWDAYYGYNFDTTTGDLLTLNNLGDNIYNIIYDECKKYLTSKNYTLNETWENLMKEELNTPGNYFFTKEGLRIVFQRSTLGAGALGIITVDIPKDKINNYLKDKYKFN